MKLNELKKTILTLINNFSYDLAIQLIRDGLALNIFDSDLYYNMGLIYKYKKNYNCAYLCFENALQYSKEKKKQEIIISEMKKLVKSDLVHVNNFSIIILTFNNLKYTQECIESIRKYNTLSNYEIIIIDNNSIDDTPDWLKSQTDIKYILNDENKGFPAGCNQGINLAIKTNDIFLLNNDTLIMPNSIFNLRMGLYSDNEIGAASSVSNAAPFQTIQDKFSSISEYLTYSIKNNITNDNRYDYRLTLIGFALFFKRNVLNEVGLLDELFTPGNYEDTDITLRILQAGYKNILCKDSFVYHYGSKSFGKNTKRYKDILDTNSKKFQAKWKFDPFKSLRTRNDLLQLIDEPFNAPLNILEVGCACGGTLLEIKNVYPNASIYGFDLDNNTAEIAKCFANMIIGDIENFSMDYEETYFDYIILADVLNCLRDPFKTINYIKKYLKHDGYVLASIPNILNYELLKNLINGNWLYDDEGFIDNIRLRLFTCKDIITMFKNANYNNLFITSIANTPKTSDDVEFISKLSELSNYENISEELINLKYYIKANHTSKKDSELERKFNTQNELNIIIKELNKNLKNDYLLNELVNLIKHENISYSDIIKAVEHKITHQGKVLNYIAIKCFQCCLNEYVYPLLEKAYSLEPRDLDITYNLSFFLAQNGKYELALDHLNLLLETNENIEELKNNIISALH